MNTDDLIRELQSVKILEKLQLKEGTTELRDIHNNLYGRLEETDDEVVVYDIGGYPLGKYIKSQDMTTTMSGAIVGYGNTVVNFLHAPR